MSNNKPPLLEWESFPLRENPKKSVFLVLFLLSMFFFLWFLTIKLWEMPLFFLLGIAFLLFDLLPYFIPTRYLMQENKIVIYYLFIRIEKRYEDFGCFYADEKGVMLGTFVRPRWLDKYRGQSLRYSHNQSEKEALLQLLEKKIGNRR
jgi:hypothetical protein